MSKPFNLADAKAGHPVATSFGQRATILKFDCNAGNLPLLGIVTDADVVARWTADGRHADATVGFVFEYNLVMAPIGTIDDKPVYPGDMITVDGISAKAQHDIPFPLDAKWPRVYPRTQMGGKELEGVYMDTNAGGDGYDDHIAVANAAIRHGIDNGYLLDPRDLEQRVSIKLPDLSPEELERIISTPPRCNNYGCVIKPVQDVERERKIMREGIKDGIGQCRNGNTPMPVDCWHESIIDGLIARVK